MSGGVDGHAIVRHGPDDWRCKCGMKLSARREGARDVMRFHRLDLQKAGVAGRLLERSERAESGCLRWTGAHVPKGYGQIRVSGQVRSVHVVAHEIWIGPVPDGYDVDHVQARGCQFRDCIEPSHLEAVTHAENVRRAAALITHCAQGHEFTSANTRWVRRNNRGGALSRRCRECQASQRARKARNAA